MSVRVLGMSVSCLVVFAFGVPVAQGDTASSTTRSCAPPDGVNPHDDPVLAPPADTAAKELLRKGKGAHRAQDYDEAIEAFKEGAKRSSAPVFLYSLGQSLRVSDRFEEAIRAYELFLDRAQPGDALRAVVECHIANMRADLDRAAMTMPPTDQPNDALSRVSWVDPIAVVRSPCTRCTDPVLPTSRA